MSPVALVVDRKRRVDFVVVVHLEAIGVVRAQGELLQLAGGQADHLVHGEEEVGIQGEEDPRRDTVPSRETSLPGLVLEDVGLHGPVQVGLAFVQELRVQCQGVLLLLSARLQMERVRLVGGTYPQFGEAVVHVADVQLV